MHHRQADTSSSVWRAERRVLFHARNIALEALGEREDEVFFSIMSHAARELLAAIGADPTTVNAIWIEAVREVDNG